MFGRGLAAGRDVGPAENSAEERRSRRSLLSRCFGGVEGDAVMRDMPRVHRDFFVGLLHVLRVRGRLPQRMPRKGTQGGAARAAGGQETVSLLQNGRNDRRAPQGGAPDVSSRPQARVDREKSAPDVYVELVDSK